MTGILGKKIGMSQVIQEDGKVLPVTVVQCEPNTIVHVKTTETDGYNALVLGLKKMKKPSKTKKFYHIKEVALEEGADGFKKGEELTVDVLKDIKTVKITGISKGKGFQGVIKRHNFARGPETHGSHHHREPGSIGACAKPGRVHKGKKLPGRMGGKQVSKRGVDVVHVDFENNLVCLKGPVPGANGSLVIINA